MAKGSQLSPVKYKTDYGQVLPKAEEPTIIKDHLPSQGTETQNTE